ncbi:neuroglobin, partial [Biomphalaria pfeifferi]
LFRSNSELQAMFKGFKDIKTDSELRSNEALENHATLVMTTLDDAITHIDNYEYVKDLLYRTSSTHTKFTGFQPAYFMHVKEPFLEAVRVTLGDRYTDNMQNIYTIAITYVLQTLKEGMEEALK